MEGVRRIKRVRHYVYFEDHVLRRFRIRWSVSYRIFWKVEGYVLSPTKRNAKRCVWTIDPSFGPKNSDLEPLVTDKDMAYFIALSIKESRNAPK